MDSDDVIESLIKRLMKEKRSYIENGSIQGKNKQNYLNKKQAKFRPDVSSKDSKDFGLNTKRSYFDRCVNFNERNY
jgi:hypothetical protein